MQCKDRLEALLRDNAVPFRVQHHPLAYTAQQVAASEYIPGKLMTQVVMAHADGKLVMLALPAPRRVDVEKSAAALGANEVRLTQEQELAATFPDCQVGAMPPFGNLYNVPVYVDKVLTDDDTIAFRAGTHTDTISLKYADFERLVKPIGADLARG